MWLIRNAPTGSPAGAFCFRIRSRAFEHEIARRCSKLQLRAGVPGNVDTGIGTTTQLTVFYRFSS
jgi:hypothetical protein